MRVGSLARVFLLGLALAFSASGSQQSVQVSGTVTPAAISPNGDGLQDTADVAVEYSGIWQGQSNNSFLQSFARLEGSDAFVPLETSGFTVSGGQWSANGSGTMEASDQPDGEYAVSVVTILGRTLQKEGADLSALHNKLLIALSQLQNIALLQEAQFTLRFGTNSNVEVQLVPQSLDQAFELANAALLTEIGSLLAGMNSGKLHTKILLVNTASIGPLTIDTSAPAVSFVRPEVGESYANALYVEISLSPDVEPDSVQLSAAFGATVVADLQFLLTQTGTSLQGYLPAEVFGAWMGDVVLTVSGADAAGNTAEDNVTVVGDLIPPQLLVSSPIDALATADAQVSISFTGLDAESGLASTATLIVDSVATSVVLDGNGSASYVPLGGWSDGSHTWQIVLSDRAGNTYTSASRTFLVDTQAPILVSQTPQNGSVITSVPPQFILTYSDLSALATVNAVANVHLPFGDITTSVTLGISGMQASPDLPDTGFDFSFSMDVQATDALGHVGTQTINYSVDAYPPFLQIFTPDGTVVAPNQSSITLQGSVFDTSFVSLTLNGVPLQVNASGTFSENVNLLMGSNTFAFVGSDSYGRTTSRTITILRGGAELFSDPAIRFTEPDILGYFGDDFESGSVSDNWIQSGNPIASLVDGKLHLDTGMQPTGTMGSQTFVVSKSLFDPQSFEIEASATIQESTTGEYITGLIFGSPGNDPQFLNAVASWYQEQGTQTTQFFIWFAAAGDRAAPDQRNNLFVMLPGTPATGVPVRFTIAYDISTRIATITVPEYNLTHTVPNVVFDRESYLGIVAFAYNIDNAAMPLSADSRLEMDVDYVSSNLEIKTSAYETDLSPFEYNGNFYNQGFSSSPAIVLVDSFGATEVLADHTPLQGVRGLDNISVALISNNNAHSTIYYAGNQSTFEQNILANLAGATLDQFLPDYFVANGYGVDYSIRVPNAPETYFLTANPVRTTANATFAFAGTGATSFECSREKWVWEPCSSPATITATYEGVQAFYVRALDAQGNPDPTPIRHIWFVDNTPPRFDFVVSPSVPTEPLVSIAVSNYSYDGSTFDCRINGVSLGDCSANPHLSTTNVVVGVNQAEVVGTDIAGNQAVVTKSFNAIFELPIATIDVAPPAVTSSGTAVFEFSSASPDVVYFVCQLDTGQYGVCTSPTTYEDLFGTTHTFNVKTVHRLGVVQSLPTSYSWNIQYSTTEAHWTQKPETASSSTVAAFKIATNKPSSIACALNGQPVDCTYPSWQFAGLADGTHTIEVAITGDDGISSNSVLTHTWTVDSNLPETYIDSITYVDPSGQIPIVGFHSSDVAASFFCASDEGEFAACNSPHSFGMLAEGQHVLKVASVRPNGAYDPTPITATVQVTDNTPPILTKKILKSSYTTEEPVIIHVESNEPATLICDIDGQQIQPCEMPLVFLSGELSEGIHSFSAMARDAKMLWSVNPVFETFEIRPLELDVSIGEPVIVSENGDGTVNMSVNFETTDAEGKECRVVNGLLFWGASFQCDSPWQFVGTPGRNIVEVIAGNGHEKVTKSIAIDVVAAASVGGYSEVLTAYASFVPTAVFVAQPITMQIAIESVQELPSLDISITFRNAYGAVATGVTVTPNIQQVHSCDSKYVAGFCYVLDVTTDVPVDILSSGDTGVIAWDLYVTNSFEQEVSLSSAFTSYKSGISFASSGIPAFSTQLGNDSALLEVPIYATFEDITSVSLFVSNNDAIHGSLSDQNSVRFTIPLQNAKIGTNAFKIQAVDNRGQFIEQVGKFIHSDETDVSARKNALVGVVREFLAHGLDSEIGRLRIDDNTSAREVGSIEVVSRISMPFDFHFVSIGRAWNGKILPGSQIIQTLSNDQVASSSTWRQSIFDPELATLSPADLGNEISKIIPLSDILAIHSDTCLLANQHVSPCVIVELREERIYFNAANGVVIARGPKAADLLATVRGYRENPFQPTELMTIEVSRSDQLEQWFGELKFTFSRLVEPSADGIYDFAESNSSFKFTSAVVSKYIDDFRKRWIEPLGIPWFTTEVVVLVDKTGVAAENILCNARADLGKILVYPLGTGVSRTNNGNKLVSCDQVIGHFQEVIFHELGHVSMANLNFWWGPPLMTTVHEGMSDVLAVSLTGKGKILEGVTIGVDSNGDSQLDTTEYRKFGRNLEVRDTEFSHSVGSRIARLSAGNYSSILSTDQNIIEAHSYGKVLGSNFWAAFTRSQLRLMSLIDDEAKVNAGLILATKKALYAYFETLRGIGTDAAIKSLGEQMKTFVSLIAAQNDGNTIAHEFAYEFSIGGVPAGDGNYESMKPVAISTMPHRSYAESPLLSIYTGTATEYKVIFTADGMGPFARLLANKESICDSFGDNPCLESPWMPSGPFATNTIYGSSSNGTWEFDTLGNPALVTYSGSSFVFPSTDYYDFTGELGGDKIPFDVMVLTRKTGGYGGAYIYADNRINGEPYELIYWTKGGGSSMGCDNPNQFNNMNLLNIFTMVPLFVLCTMDEFIDAALSIFDIFKVGKFPFPSEFEFGAGDCGGNGCTIARSSQRNDLNGMYGWGVVILFGLALGMGIHRRIAIGRKMQ